MGFRVPVLVTAIFAVVLAMGVLGLAVLLPIAAIQWTWNSVMSLSHWMPLINVWQATLLYIAGAIILWLSGIITIEFELEKLD